MNFKRVTFKDLKPGLETNDRIVIATNVGKNGDRRYYYDVVYVNKRGKEVVIDSGELNVLSAAEFDQHRFIWQSELEASNEL